MPKKRKKYRIRWGRLFLLFIILALIAVVIYYAVVGIIALVTGGVAALSSFGRSLFAFGSDDEAKADSAVVVQATPQQLAESKAMTLRIDSLMKLPMRLDTNNIAISIYDITTQQQVFSLHETQLLPPASTMKIATAITAAKQLGLNHTYNEAILVRGKMKGDTLVGNLLLKADDDPLLESFEPLARKVHQSGIRHIRGNIYLALAREDTLSQHPTAKAWDIPYNKTPLLLKGKRYVERTLTYTLHACGVTFRKDDSVKPDGIYRCIAKSSHRLRDVITPMMIHSSNIKAEAVFYHLDYKQGLIKDHRMHWTPPHATERYLRKVFIADSTAMKGFVFNDGSGLSPDNRLTANFLVGMLKFAYDDKPLRDYFINEALATPDDGVRRGSLLSRMQQPEYRGRIFCKTGTVVTIGASSLAGYLKGSDGHWYIFAIINTDSPVAESRIFQDRLCKLMMSGKR